ncbi:hypothetical protein WJ41_03160 [Burkholderia ubonensis]|nr:hypothetical protein WJ41_03160 [Burkholderia ubonensis]
MVDVIEAAFPFAAGWMDSEISFADLESPAGTGRDATPISYTERALSGDLRGLSVGARSLVEAVVKADKEGLPSEAFSVLKETLKLFRRDPGEPLAPRGGIEDPPQ